MTPNPQYVILFHHFRRLLEALNAEGIDAAPIKGAHLLTSVYPEEEGRGMIADVDFLVRDNDWLRVLEIMEELDFERRDHFADETMTQEAGFYLRISPETRVLFEAHRHLFNQHRLRIDHEAVWGRSIESDFEGVLCRRLAAEDHFCHIALHSLVHRLDPLERAVRDLELLLLADDAVAGRVVERAREWGTTRVVWLFFKLIAKRGNFADAELFARFLRPPLRVRVAIKALVPGVEGTRLHSLNYRLQAAMLWPVLFDRPSMAARFAANHPLVLKALKKA